MVNLRTTSAFASPFLVLLVCHWATSVAGYPYSDDDLATRDGSRYRENPWRLKRMSQISCHCCSNSFNSHCCLQCMQRIGKRSDSLSLNNASPLSETGDARDSEYADYPGAKDAACDCCALQKYRFPYAQWLPCCDMCKSRLKRSVATIHLQKTDDAAKSS